MKYMQQYPPMKLAMPAKVAYRVTLFFIRSVSEVKNPEIKFNFCGLGGSYLVN